MGTLLSTLPTAEISWRQQKGEPYLSDVRLQCLYLTATAYPCGPLHMEQHFRPIQCTTQLDVSMQVHEKGIFLMEYKVNNSRDNDIMACDISLA